ncbi:MAG TPA: biotin--[acetyl-CoA-carboxylase] ligase [Stellaceae bacterium]|nr:biotin--[acetyl-CoA-carboxylase] ligase [Stellaceae bacterium]
MNPASRLPACCRLVSYDTIGSTSDEAKRLARAGAPAWTVVWAREQTAGRGRRGRPWVSPRGNLYVSLVLRPACPPDHAARLGFAAALAVGDALADLVPGLTGLSCKWPNDVLLDGGKVAGLLLESEVGQAAETAAEPGNAENFAFLVVGIGINLAAAPAGTEFPATSLAAARHAPPEPAVMLESLLRNFVIWEQRWREEGFAPIRAAWLERAAGRGEAIRVRLEHATLHGTFADLDEGGSLVLRAVDGLRRIAAGDVFPAG